MSSPQIPGVPDPTPAAATPAAPAAPVQPQVVKYADQDAIVRGKVYGQEVDYKVADLLKKAQMTDAAEQKFAQANRLLNENRGAIEFATRVESLMRAGQVAEARALIESRTGGRFAPERQETDDGGEEPSTKGLRAELESMKRQLLEQAGTINQVVTAGQTAQHRNQVQAALAEYPLFKADPKLAEVASALATGLLVNPIRDEHGRQVSFKDALGEVHAALADTLQRQTQAKHDTLTATADALRGLPPQTGTPGLTMPEMPEISKEDWQNGKWKKTFKDVVQKAARSV